ncbi:MAG: adenosine kinase [Bacteroidaceae bacterium]|nr:adenosine kinase [Bacteroidaceae bacterium]
MKKILCVGNALVDRLFTNTADTTLSAIGLERGGMSLIDDERSAWLADHTRGMACEYATGGSSSNTALALAHLRGQVGYVGMIGGDEVGAFYERTLREAGVRTHLLRDSKTVTGIANTFISPDGERTFATHLGAASLLGADLISMELMEGYDILYVEGYLLMNHDLAKKIMRTADRLGMEIALDLSSYNIVAADRDFFRQILADYVDIVFANEQEALAFAFPDRPVADFSADAPGYDEQLDTAATILSRICRTAVVKCGSKGSVYHHADERGVCREHALPRSQVVDTTAAGDFFAAGFFSQYAAGADIDTCMRKAAEVAAEVIKVVGTRLSDETWARLAQ